MTTPRDSRLLSEFEKMKDLCARNPNRLFDFRCADLSEREAFGFKTGSISWGAIEADLPGFVTSEEFERRNPGIPPEKYLIAYTCGGLELQKDGTVHVLEFHMMEVVFGLQYPSERPIFIWLTPILHPNFRGGHICLEGRPFAVGLTLAQLVPEIGRMIQYQNYNIKDPLDRDASEWAARNAQHFPIDERDILDYRRLVKVPKPPAPLIELVTPNNTGALPPGQIIEVIPTE